MKNKNAEPDELSKSGNNSFFKMRKIPSKRLKPFFNKKYIPLFVILPNIITLSSLFMGMLAIKFAIEGHHLYSVNLILAAALLDAFDGRIARMLKGTTRFGAELDSLADVVNFGIAPAFVIYTFSLENSIYGWIAVYIFSISTAMRLARFNVSLGGDDKPKWFHDYFVGIPAPSGALLSLLPLYLTFAGNRVFGFDIKWILENDYVISVYVIFIGSLMVSSIKTFSGKFEGLKVDRSLIPVIFFGIIFAISLIYIYYWHSLYIICFAYLLHMPFSHFHYIRRLRSFNSKVVAPVSSETLDKSKKKSSE